MIHKYLPRIEFSSYEDFYENYKVIVPENFNFGFDIVDGWAKEDKNKPALVWCNDDGQEIRYTFDDIRRMSNKIANVFKPFGLKKGDTVMLMLKQRPEVWGCFVALCKMGVICIPATFQLTPKDIIYRCNAANVKMIVAVDDNDIINHVNASRGDCKTLETVALVGENIPEGFVDFRAEIEKSSDVFERPTGNEATKNTDPMMVYFSSGTTGMPKMVLHNFTYPLGHITTAYYWHRVQDGGLHLTVSDSGWAKFAWGKIFGQWICGAIIVAYDTDKFVPVKLLETIDRLKLTTFCAPPTIYRFLIREDMSGYDFSTIKHATTAGEPLNPEVFNKFKAATGLEITEGFGQTESTVMLANYSFFEVRPGSTGKPSPLYDIDIVDEDGNHCEDGIVGSIVIKTKNYPVGLFQQYYHDLEANARAFHDGLYNTGDTAWRDADGYFWFVGRSDDVIKCSGYRIGPFEVESALLTHGACLECAVTAVPDSVRGQVVKATIVLNKGYIGTEELKKELQEHVKRVTAPYKYPRVVEFVDELPKTIGGKIRRVQIRQEDEGKI